MSMKNSNDTIGKNRTRDLPAYSAVPQSTAPPRAPFNVLAEWIITAGTAVAQWLRCCATNRKVAGSIPDGVIGIFH